MFVNDDRIETVHETYERLFSEEERAIFALDRQKANKHADRLRAAGYYVDCGDYLYIDDKRYCYALILPQAAAERVIAGVNEAYLANRTREDSYIGGTRYRDSFKPIDYIPAEIINDQPTICSEATILDSLIASAEACQQIQQTHPRQ